MGAHLEAEAEEIKAEPAARGEAIYDPI